MSLEIKINLRFVHWCDFNVDNTFKYIVHLADIHIRNNYERDDEYKAVFRDLDTSINMNTLLNKKNTCIVIAGDIFHDARKEGKLSPNAMLLFTDFIENLNAFGTVVIIPGNHDNNITYQNSEDTTKVDSLTSV